MYLLELLKLNLHYPKEITFSRHCQLFEITEVIEEPLPVSLSELYQESYIERF